MPKRWRNLTLDLSSKFLVFRERKLLANRLQRLLSKRSRHSQFVRPALFSRKWLVLPLDLRSHLQLTFIIACTRPSCFGNRPFAKCRLISFESASGQTECQRAIDVFVGRQQETMSRAWRTSKINMSDPRRTLVGSISVGITKKITANYWQKHCQQFAVSLITRPGFEPGQTEPKSVVLPLHYRVSRWVIYRMDA